MVAGALAWFVAGGPSSGLASLDAASAEVSALRSPHLDTGRVVSRDVSGMAAAPLFTLTTGPGAVPEPVIQLAGLTRARDRVAALVSINDRPTEWLRRGESRDGVTLQEVRDSSVVVDTVYGPREVALGDRSAATVSSAAVGAAASTPAPLPAATVPPPRGFRMPPAPASAPKGP